MIVSNPENPREQNDRPSILVFDVNETLLDIEAIAPLFARLFGHAQVLREWFGQLVLYSGVVTLSGLYQDFFALGQGVLRMLAEIHKVDIHSSDIDELKTRMLNMPAHPDVSPGLSLLKDAGFRLVTLTNSPPDAQGSPLERAGIAASLNVSSVSIPFSSSNPRRRCIRWSHL
jgi:2-haloacid dehalogenase